ncbi:MAG TPA: metalloregulator ArsR/SmtB family transcription factor [bacterium]|nr:metalloregulator ArsR/SmtB family transcription factor [bacterium]
MSRQPADADVFLGIANPTRRALLLQLREGEQPVTRLAESLPVSLPAVSQQLKVLRDAGLVQERRAGRQRLYSLSAEPLREVAEWVALYEQFWSEKLDALGAYLEKSAPCPPESTSSAPTPTRRRRSGTP